MKNLLFITAVFLLALNGQAQNVGIGTVTPLVKLHVSGGASGNTTPFAPLVVEGNGNTYMNLLSPNANETAVLFGKASDAASGGIIYNNLSTPNGFQFRINGNATRMVIDNTGKVGIGTLLPYSPFTFNDNFGEKISMYGNAASNFGFGVQDGLFQIHSNSIGSDIGIGTGSSTSFNEIIRIKGAGYIGIGTASPAAKLHVSAGDESLTLYGPNIFGGKLYVGAAPNQGVALTAQVIATNGNLHIDPASGKNIYLGNYQAGDIYLNPNGGKVGIGTTTPAYTLDVTGDFARTGNFVNTKPQGSHGIYSSCNITPYYGIGVDGFGGWIGIRGLAMLPGFGNRSGVEGYADNGTGYNYGVAGYSLGGTISYGIYGAASGGTTNWAGYFNGNVHAAGVYTSSDRKLKNDIKPLSGAMSIIEQLKPSVYIFKTNEYKQLNLPEGLQYGLIADEVQQVLPGAVKKAVQPAVYENHDEHNGKKLSDAVEFNAVNYTEIIPILIGAVKEQQLIIDNLQKQIDELKKIVEKLRKQ